MPVFVCVFISLFCLCDSPYIVAPFSTCAIFPHQDGVTLGLEVLLPKEAKLHPETKPPLEYDVFLYKVANNGASPTRAHPTHSTNLYSTSHPIPKSPKTPKSPRVPKSPKSPKHPKEHPLSSHQPLSGRHSSPGQHPSSGRHPSPNRHSAPGSYTPPSCHPSSYHSPSKYKCMPTSTSPQLNRPVGRSQAPGLESSRTGREYHDGHIRPSPSSPHLTQPPPSPSKVKYSPVSTRSLPPLS